jgi:hypothetical protein
VQVGETTQLTKVLLAKALESQLCEVIQARQRGLRQAPEFVTAQNIPHSLSFQVLQVHQA